MTSIALGRVAVPSSTLSSLLARNRTLAVYGIACLVLGMLAILGQSIDTRMLESGVNVWVKPAKFLVSVGVFAVTAAWFFGYVRPERRNSRLMRATAAILITTGTFELVYIGWQAAQGLESHFNVSTPFTTAMYAMMGIAAVLLVGTTFPLAWEIGRRPVDGLQRSFVAAIVIGLLLTFVLGGGLGGYMSSQLGHSVGATGGHVVLFGWNRLGGDLRVAHFFGIHAEQAIPILAALTVTAPARGRWAIVILGSVAYSAVTLAVFAQAVAGRALIPA
jgi:hypothetical protein